MPLNTLKKTFSNSCIFHLVVISLFTSLYFPIVDQLNYSQFFANSLLINKSFNIDKACSICDIF